MTPFFDLAKAIYQKIPINPDVDTSLCIALTRWLAKDENNTLIISKLVPFLFYIDPLHYFYLLYTSIPRKYRIPSLQRTTRTKTKDNKLLDKIKEVLGWSNRIMKSNEYILNKVVLTDKKYWKQQLGLK